LADVVADFTLARSVFELAIFGGCNADRNLLALAFFCCFLWPTLFRHLFIVNHLLDIVNQKMRAGKDNFGSV
jgi:hypothetical protein